MEKEIKFPLIFNKCPNPKCGSTRTVISEIRKQYSPKVEGEPDQALTVIATPVASRAEMLFGNIAVPWLEEWLTTCADCGTVYCMMANVEKRIPPRGS